MTHPDIEAQVDAYLDGELAAVEARELEGHVAQCASCGRFRDGRLALRAAIRARVPAYEAPDTLRQRLQRALRSASPARAAGRFGAPVAWRALAVAASLVLVASGSWRLARQRAAGDALAEAVVATHVRSLMPGHLTDVLSSDQHTVKPWFNGRVDYSPPVYDFAGRGYPLIGGRLDYVGGRPVAVLVYGRRQHLISVFLWPTTAGATAPAGAGTRQGYHLLRWTSPPYEYWVVSDLGLAELQDFAGLLRQADTTAQP